MPGGSAMLGAGLTGLAIGGVVASGIYAAGTSDYDDTSKATNAASKKLVAAQGAGDISNALIEAKEELRKIQDKRGMFGGFMDFVQGGNADIKGLESLIAGREKELQDITSGRRASPTGGPKVENPEQAIKAELPQGQFETEMLAALRSGPIQIHGRVEVANLPTPGSALEPPNIGPAGRPPAP